MISRDEVLEFAREFQLAANVVEKDYALGWLLAGISNHRELSDTWVFKGGTCLKKCFFETYRFSEDLDFTLRDPAHLDEAFLSRVFYGSDGMGLRKLGSRDACRSAVLRDLHESSRQSRCSGPCWVPWASRARR